MQHSKRERETGTKKGRGKRRRRCHEEDIGADEDEPTPETGDRWRGSVDLVALIDGGSSVASVVCCHCDLL